MLIYNSKVIQLQVHQHPYLKVYDIMLYGECDNPRSYGRHIDWYTYKQVTSIYDVNTIVRKLENEH